MFAIQVARIPFSISLAWAANTIATSPQPPPRSEERVKLDSSAKELSLRAATCKVFPALAKIFPALAKILLCAHIFDRNAKACFMLHAVIEVALIVANGSIWGIGQGHSTSHNIRITWTFIIAWFFAISGTLIRRHCYQLLGEMFTFELSIRAHHRLIKRGPYAIVRHPSYAGVMVTLLGASLCYSTPGAWTMEYAYSPWAWFMLAFCWTVTTVAWIFMIRRTNTEDAMLRKKFGKEWEEWAKKVPSKLVPGMY